MKRKNIRNAFFIVLLISIGVAYYGYKEYNRKNVALTDASASYTLNAAELINQFNTDDKKCNSKYLSKIIEVSGKIKAIDTAANKGLTAVLGQEDSQTSVRCSMDSLQQIEPAQFAIGHTVTIKGVYTGFNADEMGLGSDILFNRCVVIKK